MSTSALVKLANFFEVSIDYLLCRENDMGIISLSTELSPDQSELLDLYNKMSFRDRNQLLGFAKGLVY